MKKKLYVLSGARFVFLYLKIDVLFHTQQDQFENVKSLYTEIKQLTEEGSFIVPEEHVFDHQIDQKVHPETGNTRHTFVKDIAITTFP